MDEPDDNDEYDAVLGDAAERARVLIEKREMRRVLLLEQVRRIDAELAALNAVVAAAEPVITPEFVTQAMASLSEADGKNLMEHIEILLGAGEKLTAQKIRAALAAATGKNLGQSTVYGYLARGKDLGKFVSEKGIWKLAQTERLPNRPITGAAQSAIPGWDSRVGEPSLGLPGGEGDVPGRRRRIWAGGEPVEIVKGEDDRPKVQRVPLNKE